MKSLKTRLVLSLFTAGALCAPLAFPASTSARPSEKHQTPLVYDFSGDGLSICNTPVYFDVDGDGHKELVDWPAAGSDDAFLVIDRNRDKRVNDGTELFSETAVQDVRPLLPRNGFNALAYYDDPSRGGNGDRKIDASDDVWGKLYFWTDTNHDGASTSNELKSLDAVYVRGISLSYAPRSAMLCASYVGFSSGLALTTEKPEGPRSSTMYDVYLRIFSR